MNNDIVQLTDKNGNNVFPIAGAATQDSISKSMLEEGVFEGPELFPAPAEAYVRTNDIVDGAVTSDKIDWTTINAVNYSTTEQPIGTWIDGKPLYRKVIDLGYLPNATSKSTSTDLIGAFTVVSVRGSAYVASSCLPMPHVALSAQDNIGISYNAGSNMIVVTTGTNRSTSTGIAIIEYTRPS